MEIMAKKQRLSWRRWLGRMAVTGGLALVLLGGSTVFAAGPWSIQITDVTPVENNVAVTGTAYSPAGNQSGNYVEVLWGDGVSETLANFTEDPPWTWAADHTYAGPGTYTITARLLHASPNGRDASENAIDTETVVIGDGGDNGDNGDGGDNGDNGDDGDDTSGTPDSGSDDQQTEALDETVSADADDSKVLGNRVSKKAASSGPKRLAKTGTAEGIAVVAFGIMLIAMGAHLKYRVSLRPPGSLS